MFNKTGGRKRMNKYHKIKRVENPKCPKCHKELKEQLKKYIEGTFKEKSSKLLKNYPPKKKEKKQIIFTQCF